MKRTLILLLIVSFCLSLVFQPAVAQSGHSVARLWNEALLEAIRNDYARPVVHARNLFHTSAVMYDAWAAYDETAEPFLLGNLVHGYTCPFGGVDLPVDVEAAREKAISYAAYRLLSFRFHSSPGRDETLPSLDALMANLGYDPSITATEYWNGDPAALGNAIAACYIAFGQQDGANEQNDYASLTYLASNEPLLPVIPGNPDLSDPNHWQPLSLNVAIDQAGNLLPFAVPPFLGPEWGRVVPFALPEDKLTRYERTEIDQRLGEYWVYHDPGPPPYVVDETGRTGEATVGTGSERADEYLWTFAQVGQWSSQLDPADGVMWDISPASSGNLPALPVTLDEIKSYYDGVAAGNLGAGRDLNPVTGQPYTPQFVPRGDFTRVLAEFWADGPDSETPPGHWFTILNYVSDHPSLVKQYKGEEPLLNDLAWDVKSYFALGGAMHDAAVAAWGIKGWYDYIRPVSALRYMADQGQSSDPGLPNYSEHGMPLVDGLAELVEAGDPLAGEAGENVGKVKLYGWRGPDFIEDPLVDVAGVGWILAENWWPYQRPTFVTPPFAGYVSGHSTYSRAAAEVLTQLTGDEYFPGGMAEFTAPQNEFLHFEDGPSVDVTLQWATYQDAAHQSGLSRIWGGIHPPADDIPGRRIGIDIGTDAFALADRYIQGTISGDAPHLFNPGHQVTTIDNAVTLALQAYDVTPPLVYSATNLPPGLSIVAETGVISGVITGSGTYSVTASIWDESTSGQPIDSTSFPWRVNLPPVIEPIPVQFNMMGDYGILAPTVNDPDGDRLHYTADGLIPDLVIGEATGEISGTLAFNGKFTIKIRVRDDYGGTDLTEFRWHINRLPAIGKPGDQANLVGDQVQLTLRAIDSDGDALTYSAADLPDGLMIDPMTGVISGTLTQGGIFTPTVIVDDGFTQIENNTSEGNSSTTGISFRWVVNTPPTLVNPGDQVNQRGETVSVSLVGDDADGDPVTYRAIGLPFGLNFDSSLGVITGTLLGSGTYSVTVTAADERGGETSIAFDWIANLPPALTMPEAQSSDQWQMVQLLVVATDSPEDSLHFVADGLPPGLEIDSATGRISGGATKPGTYPVTITIDDGLGGTVSGSFTWIVNPSDAQPLRICVQSFCVLIPMIATPVGE